MEQGREKAEGMNISSLLPPYNRAICTKLEKPGLSPRASSFPSYTYPKVVERAYRTSTRVILKLILDTLREYSGRVGPVNASAIARAAGYHRKTVERALAFGIRFKVIERVVLGSVYARASAKHPGRPVRYKSLWKLTTSKRAPSSKNSYKVQALASTKTGLIPSRRLRSAAMLKIRLRLDETGQPRLTSAYGKYVWSKAATVAGIALLVRTASAMINNRTKTLPLRDAFAVVVQNINLACRSLDATERYLATLKREALPDDIDDLFQKPTVANIDNYVDSQYYFSHLITNIPPEPHPKCKGVLSSTNDRSSIPPCATGVAASSRLDDDFPGTKLEGDEDRPAFHEAPDGLLQRWRTVIHGLTEDDVDPDAQPQTADDDDRARPRAGPHGRHGGAVPRPFGPRRATRGDDELVRRRRQARRSLRMTERSDALGASAVQSTQRRDARALITDADH